MYIATKFIGNTYAPGDPLPEDLNPDTLSWLIRAKAVREEAPAPEVRADPPEAPETEPEAEIPPEAPAAEIPETTEIDEDVEAPEIDVMEGIVKPKRRRGGKKA